MPVFTTQVTQPFAFGATYLTGMEFLLLFYNN